MKRSSTLSHAVLLALFVAAAFAADANPSSPSVPTPPAPSSPSPPSSQAPAPATRAIIETAIHQFSYAVWASKYAVFNAISVAFQLASVLVGAVVVNTGIAVAEGVAKKITNPSPQDVVKMEKIVAQTLKKFAERSPGLFPHGLDFEHLARRVVADSLPRPNGQPKTIKSLDDYSPEVQAMVGFSPADVAAAQEHVTREALKRAELASSVAADQAMLKSHAPAIYAPPPPPPTYAPPPPPAPTVYAPPPPTYAPPPPPAPTGYAPPPPAYSNRTAASNETPDVSTRQCAGRRVDSTFGNSVYMYSWLTPGSPRYNWAAARAFCQSVCMDLVAMESPQENAFIKSVSTQAWQQGQIPYHWTAGSRSGGGFVWATTGVPMPGPGQPGSDWGIRQPDDRETAENCVAFMNPSVYNEPSGQFAWHDIACHYEKPIICEGQQ